MHSNFRIAEHRTRYKARCASRFIGTAAREFWEGFAKPVLIVALGVALSSPIAAAAGSIMARIMER